MTGRLTATRPVITGIGVGRGAVVAPLAVVRPAPPIPADEPAPIDRAAAVELVEAAFAKVRTQLSERAAATAGPLSDVLEATSQMAGDPALLADASARIRAGAPPATAVDAATEAFSTMFAQAGGYLAERVTDLRSVRDRVVAVLLNAAEPGLTPLSEPSVVAAEDLSPADTAGLDRDTLAAIVTEQGGPTGHTAIIAAQLGIPCVVRAAGATAIPVGTLVAVDAAAGTVLADPPDDVVAQLRERARLDVELAQDAAPGATSDGQQVALLANVGTVADARNAADTACEGVGLFRTEVLFLGRTSAPTLEEQSQAYRAVITVLGSRKVVVRTLDAGADKPLAFATQDDEPNPALGVRGNRLLRTLPDLVDGQLSALGAAARSDDGGPTGTQEGSRLWVMAPMVATAAEARDFAARARERGIRQVGVMIEIPAAALLAEEILAEVDFVSIGSNDLAQYTMAADRLTGSLADLLDPFQPAVLRLVARTAEAGLVLGKPVGCAGSRHPIRSWRSC